MVRGERGKEVTIPYVESFHKVFPHHTFSTEIGIGFLRQRNNSNPTTLHRCQRNEVEVEKEAGILSDTRDTRSIDTIRKIIMCRVINLFVLYS